MIKREGGEGHGTISPSKGRQPVMSSLCDETSSARAGMAVRFRPKSGMFTTVEQKNARLTIR